MTDSQGPNDAIEVGLIGDFMSFGEEDVAKLRDIAYRNGLNTHHFLNENARKAYAAIDENSGVNDSVAISDIVRNATSQEFAELAAGKAHADQHKQHKHLTADKQQVFNKQANHLLYKIILS